MKRRDFLASMTGAAAAVPLLKAETVGGDVPAPPRVTLGNTGIVTSRMIQGTGFKGTRMQSNQTRAGFESLVNLIRHGYDRGIRMLDLADQYGSHLYVREALRFIPREEMTLMTKFQYRFDGKDALTLPPALQLRMARKAIERFRMELNVNVIDIVLMHCVVTPEWDKECAGYVDALREAKEQGVIRALGMSCHTLDALKRASELDWVDVALTRINPFGVIMDGKPEVVMPVQKRFKERGAAVIGMKIYGNGRLVDKREECMRFAAGLDYLDAMTIGAETPEHVDENLRLLAKYST